MKKLSLEKLKLTHDDLLQRDQLKSVFGGLQQLREAQACKVGDNTCDGENYCIVDSYASYPNGHCGIVT